MIHFNKRRTSFYSVPLLSELSPPTQHKVWTAPVNHLIKNNEMFKFVFIFLTSIYCRECLQNQNINDMMKILLNLITNDYDHNAMSSSLLLSSSQSLSLLWSNIDIMAHLLV